MRSCGQGSGSWHGLAGIVLGGLLGAWPAAAAPDLLRGLPASFEPNWGQAQPGARFLSRGRSYTLLLGPAQVLLRLNAPGRESATVRMRLAGARAEAEIAGRELLAGQSSYFIGSDVRRWRTGIPRYGRVEYRGVYPGVDLVIYGRQGELEYDLVVAPGADADAIRLAFEGIDRLHVDGRGDLVLQVGGSQIRHHRPRIHQLVDGAHREVSGGSDAFVMKLNPSASALVYSTYLGGSGFDQGLDLAVDAGGNAYVAGSTSSMDFPVTPGTFRSAPAGSLDGFLTKLNPAGAALVYSTYLGGRGVDVVRGLLVNSAGETLLAGHTDSPDFPVTPGAFQTAAGGASDGFVMKLNASGAALVYSTYLGGSGFDRAYGIAADTQGSAYVVGATASGNFPVTPGAVQSASGGGLDGFVAKLNSTGTGLGYSTYLGGSGGEEAWAVAVDAAGAAHATGYTASANFPATPGAAQAVLGGPLDAFVVKLAPAGGALAYATYLGGTRADFGEALVVDGAGVTHVTGGTRSSDFPKPGSAFQSAYIGGDDAFLAQFSPTGVLLSASFLGGTAEDRALAVALDGSGSPLLAGYTVSADFPVTAGALQGTYSGTGGQAFLVRTGPPGASASDLAVSVAATPNPVAVGAEVAYTITVSNQGPDAAPTVKVTDRLPEMLAYVSCSAAGGGVCGGAGANRQVTYASLAAGATATMTLVVRAGAGLADGTPIVNTVSVAAVSPDPDRGNNYASATVTAFLPETVSTPATPSGPANGTVGASYTYSTAGATSSLVHSLRYRFEWGDGQDSGWLAAGVKSASHSWTAAGTYAVRVQARCATHVGSVSSYSAGLSVQMLHKIAGRVTDAGGSPISGVTVSLTGAQTASTQSNTNGDYSFAGLPEGGTYTVTPSKPSFTFTPAGRTFASLSGDQTADFTGPVTYVLSGRVVNLAGAGLGGATLVLSGSQSGAVATDAAGNYALKSLVVGGTYTVKPYKAGYSFSPASQTYSGLSANQTANFTGTRVYTISGRVVDAGGVAIAGVTVTLSGSQAKSTSTSNTGSYAFTGLPEAGTYTVTPSKTGYSFSPAGRTYSGLSADQTADFVGAPN